MLVRITWRSAFKSEIMLHVYRRMTSLEDPIGRNEFDNVITHALHVSPDTIAGVSTVPVFQTFNQSLLCPLADYHVQSSNDLRKPDHDIYKTEDAKPAVKTPSRASGNTAQLLTYIYITHTVGYYCPFW